MLELLILLQGLTDLDRSTSGGLFGREAENISGFGKKVDASDITLPTKLREKLTKEFEPKICVRRN